MDITDRIHCDNIVYGEHGNKQLLSRKPNQPMSTKKLLEKFPLNYRRDPKDKNDQKFKGSLIDIRKQKLKVPSRIDHTNKMSAIRNQGHLGSCVGFAVTAMKEFQEQQEHLLEVQEGKKDHRKGKKYDLSESWVYWMSKEIDAWPGEEGTSIRYAMKVLQKIGVPTETGWPYDDVDFGEPKRWASLVARWSLIDQYWRINNLTELKAALVNGPVPIGIPCFYEFFFPGMDGIILDPVNPTEIYGGHAICAVGFDNTTRLIKFKNSWGTNWGENGYGYISYEYIQKYLWDAWTCSDLSITKEMLKGTRNLVEE